MIALLLVLSAGHAGAAQDCGGVTPVNNALGYRARANSDRCEGLFVANRSGGGVNLLSLTFGPIALESGSTDALLLRLDTPADKLAATTLIGRGTCNEQNYLMTARDPAMPFRLPTAVLSSAHCRADDIGFYAQRPDVPGGARDIYIPVKIGTAPPADQSRPVLAVALVPQSDVQTLQWRIADAGRAHQNYNSIQVMPMLSAGKPVRFTLPVPSSPDFTLELRVVLASGGEPRVPHFDISLR